MTALQPAPPLRTEPDDLTGRVMTLDELERSGVWACTKWEPSSSRWAGQLAEFCSSCGRRMVLTIERSGLHDAATGKRGWDLYHSCPRFLACPFFPDRLYHPSSYRPAFSTLWFVINLLTLGLTISLRQGGHSSHSATNAMLHREWR